MSRGGCRCIILMYTGSTTDEMEEIGYREYFYGSGLTIIEWSELIADILPKDAMRIKIYKDPAKGFDYRRIEY